MGSDCVTFRGGSTVDQISVVLADDQGVLLGGANLVNQSRCLDAPPDLVADVWAVENLVGNHIVKLF